MQTNPYESPTAPSQSRPSQGISIWTVLFFGGPTVSILSFAIAFLLTFFKQELAGSFILNAAPSMVFAVAFYGGIVAWLIGAAGSMVSRWGS